MKPAFLLIALLLASASTTVSAQGSTEVPQRPAPISWSIHLGGGAMGQVPLTVADWRRSAPNSAVLQRGVPDGRDDFSFGDHPRINGGPFLAISVGLQPFKQLRGGSRITSELRVGFQYSGRYDRTDSRYGSEHFPYDTLTSQHTGELIEVDSVVSESYTFEQQARMFGLDASVLLRAKVGKRWEFFGGIGIAGGAILDPRTTVSYARKTYLEGGYTYSDPYFDSRKEVVEERYSAGSGTWMLGYVPLGVDFRLGKQHDEGFEFHLFTEIRPGLDYLSLSSTGDQWSSGFDGSFGVRFVLK